jgi:hypothetical protein
MIEFYAYMRRIVNKYDFTISTYNGEAFEVFSSLLGLSGHVSLHVVLLRLDSGQSFSVPSRNKRR